jgi:sugar phosphate isomerase/epimerase
MKWFLWSGTVGFRTSSLVDRAGAAEACGFEGFSLSPSDVRQAEQDGWHARDIGAWAQDRGLALIMDPVLNWHRYDDAWPFGDADVGLDETLRMCRDLGCMSMSAVAMTNSSDPLAELAGGFGRLCDRAAETGQLVHLEFIPMTVVPDLRAAWQIVSTANRENGGLLLDTWHFFRGNPDFDTLESIPGNRIFAVQLNDAEAQPVGTLWEDTRHRKLPGDGTFDLIRVLRQLAHSGGLQCVGPEVFSPELESMTAVQAAQLAAARSREVLELALGRDLHRPPHGTGTPPTRE